MKIADLFAEIGFKYDSIKLREVSKLIGDLNIASIIGATSLATLGAGISKLMTSADQTATTMLNLKEATNLDPTRVQQLDVFFQQFGANAGEAAEALHRLNTLRLQVLQGTGNAQPFILAGLSPQTETLKLLDQIHEKFKDSRFLEQWAGKFAPAAKSLEEIKASWKEMIANQFGFSSDMLRGLDSSNAEWQKQFNILTMTEEEMRKNAEAHKQWVGAVHDLNIEFQKMVTNLTPIAIDIMKIVDATAQWLNKTHGIQDFFTTMGRGIHNGIEGFGTLTNFTKAGLMNAQSFLTQNAVVNPARLHNELVKDWSGSVDKSRTVTVQTGPITVHAKDPEDFVHRFDAVWKRELMKDIQFGQQT